MSAKLPVAFVALGMFTLLIAFAVPPAISASQSTTTDTFVLGEDETAAVTDGLNVTLDDSTDGNATVTFEDTETGISETVTVNESETVNVTLNGEDVTVTVTESSELEAQLEVEYSQRYGWDAGAKTVASHLDVILLIVAFALLVGGMGAVVS